jgi:hypothetical protein
VASQFHPESRYASPEAKQIFKNYLREFIFKKRNYKLAWIIHGLSLPQM